MGPPAISPCSSTPRYFTASNPSAYLVAMPKNAATHIQNSAPGPPAFTAVATPTILPVPMVAARAVHNARNDEVSPSPWLFALKMSPSALGSRATCKNPRRRLRKTPVPTSSTSNGGPQTKLSISFNNSRFIVSPPMVQNKKLTSNCSGDKFANQNNRKHPEIFLCPFA